MRRWRKGLVVSVMAAGVLVPGGVAVAATTGPSGPSTTAVTTPVCTGDHEMLRLHDGTGWRHTTADSATVTGQPGSGYQYRSGPQDGTGPMADRPMDGTGQQWGRR